MSRTLTAVPDSPVRAVLDGLSECAAAEQARRRQLFDLVRQARRAGATWQDIADATGTSRQAAWERFSRHQDDPLVPAAR